MSERENFEAHAKRRKLSLVYGDCGYLYSSTNEAWEAWQASREALKAEPVAGDCWIACADRMPEIEDRVLVVTYGKYVSAARYTQWEGAKTARGRAPRFEDLRGIVHKVTHWMPLPSPPAMNHPIDTTSQQYEALGKGGEQ